MRILMLSQWFEPEPTFKGLMFAKELQRRGHEVEVLTGFPNYPGGKVYTGYTVRPVSRQVMDGVPVTRVALYPSHDQSQVRRALNYLSFAASATLMITFLPRPDVVYAYHPPATATLPAVVLKVLRGVPFVSDIQDLWPETLAATGTVRWEALLGVVGKVMRFLYRQAEEIVVQSDGFASSLMRRGVAADKLTVIPNWNAEDQFGADAVSDSLRARPAGAPFRVVFAGNLGRAQGLETVLEAALLSNPDTVEFVFVGSGVVESELRERAECLGLDNVKFLGRRARSEMGEVFSEADALLVHLRNQPLFEITIPSKTQAYLMVGRPILMGVSGDAARLVDAAGAGIAFEPENPAALAEAVDQLRTLPVEEREQMGARGRAYYYSQLSLDVGSSRFLDVFSRAAVRRHRFDRTKRGVDVALSSVALVASALPMAVIALLVRRRMGSPVIFRQERPGRHGRPFGMLKFRTMTDDRGSDGALLPDRDRITPLGSFLRTTSLDELPEIMNVFRGEMSIVGPRPLLPRYTEYFTEEESRRFDVRPGITGAAQVTGRNLASWDERLAMDIWYVDHMNPIVDLKLIGTTILRVLRRHGVVADPESLMPNLDDERRMRKPRERRA